MSERRYLPFVFAAAAVFALALGVRQAQPLFIGALNSHTAAGYATISLAFGIAQLMWGVAQPLAGAVADRWGLRPVMLWGALLLAAANAALPLATNAAAIIVLVGLCGAIGAGMIGPSLLVSAANRWIPEVKRSIATGIINAGGSFGQFALIPLAQLAIGLAGWQPALMILGATGLLAVPLVLFLTRGDAHPAPHAKSETLRQALRQASRDPSFLLLNAGFFTCGFHVAFIATHLPGVVALCQLPPTVSAWSLSIIGLFNIAGSLWIGKVIQQRRMKLALAWLYFARAVLILVFFFAPKTPL